MENSSAKTFGALLFYSILMFTLPFLAYFGTQSVLRDHFYVVGFKQTAWSVASAVIVVNLIAFSYVWKALHEPEIPPEDLSPEPISKESLNEPVGSVADKKED